MLARQFAVVREVHDDGVLQEPACLERREEVADDLVEVVDTGHAARPRPHYVLIREKAPDWGFEGEFTDYDVPEVTTETLVTDFSEPGDWTGDAARLSEERSTVGDQALEIEMDVENPWESEPFVEVEESIDLAGHDYLAMDMGIEAGYESLGAFPGIELATSGETYRSENSTSVQNRLFDGQWRTVYWSLSDDEFQWDDTGVPGGVTVQKLTLKLAHTSAPFAGSVFVDNVRLGSLVHEDDPIRDGETDEPDVDDSLPGFGLTSALTSAGGVAYLLKRRLSGAGDDES